MPKYSLIVPIYKVEKFIKQCMQSILNQTYKDFEVICVDDCGNDNSMKIVGKMAEKDNRIIILHHDKNRGLSAARNTGFEIAKGEYTLFIDSDDWLELNCLEVIDKHAKEHPEVDSIFFNAHKYSDNKHKMIKDSILENTYGLKEFLPYDLAVSCDYAWIKAYKTSAIRKKNLKFPEGLTFEDGEFFFKFFSLYPQSLIIPDCLYFYRERENSIVTNAQKGNIKLGDIYQVIRNIKAFFVEENLYNEYKISLAILLSNRMRHCKNIRFHHVQSLQYSLEVLKEFGTVDEFYEFDYEQHPLVSVILSINNKENLSETIKSIQNQNYYKTEIICVTKSSNTDIIDFLEKESLNDKRLKIIKNDGSNNYELGLNSAKGKYVLFVDSNDTIKQNYIKNGVDILFKNKTNFVLFNLQNEPCKAKSGRFLVDDASLTVFPIDFHNCIFDRSFILRNKLFAENKMTEMCYKNCIMSKNGSYSDKNYYIYYNNNSNMINFDEIKSLYDYLKENKLTDKYKKTFFKLFNNYIHKTHCINGNKSEKLMELSNYIKQFEELE